MSDLILLGYIVKAFGLKGGFCIKALNADSLSLEPGKTILVRSKKTERTLTIMGALDQGRVFCQEITDRDQAESLKGAEVYVSRQDLPKLEDDEFYLFDLMGAKVVDINGIWLGDVTGFSSNNAQILLEIKTPDGHKALVPAIKPIVKSINYNEKIIILDPPEGLLDGN